MTEHERRDVTADVYPCINVNCKVCSKPIRLWFNGGELDRAECCGIAYELQHTRIDYVVKDADE